MLLLEKEDGQAEDGVVDLQKNIKNFKDIFSLQIWGRKPIMWEILLHVYTCCSLSP